MDGTKPHRELLTVLGSGFGLGLYIPGLLLAGRFNMLGQPAIIEVFETLMTEERQSGILRSRKAYHRSFPVAQMAARRPLDLSSSLDEGRAAELLDAWERENRRRFLVLSGHWLPLLERYRLRQPKTKADLLYVDAGLPPSWESLRHYRPDYAEGYTEVRLYDGERAKLLHPLRVTEDAAVVPYEAREPRYLVHGGGWGMGTYRQVIPELRDRGFLLDLVAYEPEEAADAEPEERVYMIDPNWVPWRPDESGCYGFPPFGRVDAGAETEFRRGTERHGLFEVTAQARAVIGKPGAGTMIDSLGAATPLLMLEPFGEHEKVNARVWETLGFGIPYAAWKEAGFPEAPLADMHERLREALRTTPDLAEIYAKRLAGETPGPLEGRTPSTAAGIATGLETVRKTEGTGGRR